MVGIAAAGGIQPTTTKLFIQDKLKSLLFSKTIYAWKDLDVASGGIVNPQQNDRNFKHSLRIKENLNKQISVRSFSTHPSKGQLKQFQTYFKINISPAVVSY